MQKLEPEEMKVIYELFHWESSNRSIESLLNNLMLFLGGLMIVISVYKIIFIPYQGSNLYVIVSGLLSGFLFLWFYWVSRRRFNEKLRLIAVLKKLIKIDEETEE
jgi:hypothetical protein